MNFVCHKIIKVGSHAVYGLAISGVNNNEKLHRKIFLGQVMSCYIPIDHTK